MKKSQKRKIPLLRPKTGKIVRNNVHIKMKNDIDVFLLPKFLKMNRKKET